MTSILGISVTGILTHGMSLTMVYGYLSFIMGNWIYDIPVGGDLAPHFLIKKLRDFSLRKMDQTF